MEVNKFAYTGIDKYNYTSLRPSDFNREYASWSSNGVALVVADERPYCGQIACQDASTGNWYSYIPAKAGWHCLFREGSVTLYDANNVVQTLALATYDRGK